MVPTDQIAGPAATSDATRRGAATAVRAVTRLMAPTSAMLPELVSSTFGAIMCAIFVLSPNTSPTPLHILVGMVFTTAACPLTMALAPAFYRRHRTKVLLLARLVFAHNTAHPWKEELKWQQGALGWPALLLTLVYSSRGLVASWGALGWQLPLLWHCIVQGLHVVLAGWQLAPVVCQAGGPLHRTPDKLQSLALLLDWPMRAMGGPPILMPAPSACLALVLWFQVSVAFILPTALLLSIQRQIQRRARARRASPTANGGPAAGAVPPLLAQQQGAPAAGPALPANIQPPPEDDEWSIPAVSFFVAQMLWLLLRVVLQGSIA